jgi:hypothetical protein
MKQTASRTSPTLNTETMFSSEHRLTFIRLHDIMSQKTEIFNPDISWLGLLGSGRSSWMRQKCIQMDVTKIRMERWEQQEKDNAQQPIYVSLASIAMGFYYTFHKPMVHSHLNETGRPAELSWGFYKHRLRILGTWDIICITGLQEISLKPIHTECLPVGISIPVTENEFQYFIKWM